MPQTRATGAWIRQVSQRPKKAAPLMAPSRTESRPYFAIWYVFSPATFLPDSTVRPIFLEVIAILTDGTRLPVSRSGYARLLEAMGDSQGNRNSTR